MSRITIVVPCYNVEKYIEKTIIAFQQQTFKDFEVIFVDDCSSDNSVEIIRRVTNHCEIPARIFRNEKNKGPSFSRRYGISMAKSEYIAFCDSDDWIDKTFLEEMFAATEYGEHDIAFCNYRLVYEDGHFIEKKSIHKRDWYKSKKDFLVADMDGVCGGIFRKQLFADMIFPDIRNGEDMAIIPVLISKANSIGTTDSCLYNYYQRKGSLSTTQTGILVAGIRSSFAYIKENLSLEYYYSELEYLGVSNLIYGSLLNLFKQGYNTNLACEICSEFENTFPNWYLNKYVKNMPNYKKMYLWFAKNRFFWGNFFLSKIHTKLTM